jgi:thymidylate kinase
LYAHIDQRMFTVALIGPDGAGKTTIARALERSLALPVKYLYMGVNWDASDHMLPTTRVVRAVRRLRRSASGNAGGGRPDFSAAGSTRPRRVGAMRAAWRALALANRLAEEWYRQALAWKYVRAGVVVVFDRHFFADYHARDVAGASRSVGRRLHGLLLARAYPKPDLVVFLDAPAELLFARKGEGTVESLEERLADYRRLEEIAPRFVTVDASNPLDQVIADVAETIAAFAASRREPAAAGGARAA